MSVFSKDIIEKELDYRDNPWENVSFQITRYFRILYDSYDPLIHEDLINYLVVGMEKMLGQLNDWERPDFWKGTFLPIKRYMVRPLNPCPYIAIEVNWNYPAELAWHKKVLMINNNKLTIDESVTWDCSTKI